MSREEQVTQLTDYHGAVRCTRCAKKLPDDVIAKLAGTAETKRTARYDEGNLRYHVP